MSKFAVFILTYGRAENVKTYNTLRKQGYTGKIYLICSDDDKTLKDYKENYKDEVIVFCKDDYVDKFDIGDNFDDMRMVVYARNAAWDIAESIGIDYFLVLDDDYMRFNFIADSNGNYKQKLCKNLDKIFNIFLEYYKSTNALSIATIQTGDLIGGEQNRMFSGGFMKRKVMNTFFMSTKRRFKFVGRINEDVNTYITLGNKGELFLQLPDIILLQTPTQENSGGLTDFYLDTGTYFKSFYTVMYAPSCSKVAIMKGVSNPRLHHLISWNNAVSCIINEKYKKVSNG